VFPGPYRLALGFLALGVGFVVGVEVLHWHASRSGTVGRATASSCGFVVLGFRSRRDGTVHPVQRWRVDIARRSFEAQDSARVVFTGGAQPSGSTEAATMAELAVQAGIPSEAMALETQARSTWENVALALPLVTDLDCIAFCSDPLHSARARRYAVAQQPDLRGRLVSADDYRPLERWWLKVAAAVYELTVHLRSRLRS
jgi:uncharacterized SAM-binding protein YcdF (DUF218 family)